jgi:hypothetical protein
MRSAQLKAIAVPRIVSRSETRVLPSSAADALAAVAPSTLLQLPGNGPHLMRMLSATVRSVPCFALEVGSDPRRIPPALESLLDQI